MGAQMFLPFLIVMAAMFVAMCLVVTCQLLVDWVFGDTPWRDLPGMIADITRLCLLLTAAGSSLIGLLYALGVSL